MDFLDKLMNKVDQGIAVVSSKSENLAETARTKSAIAAAQRRQESAQAALGAKCYQSWKAGTLTVESLGEDLEQIRAIETEVEELKAQLSQIGAEEGQGAVVCPNCGKTLSPESRLCDSCGTPVNKTV